MHTSSITSKGQVTIPVSIRKRWGLKTRKHIMFIDKTETVEIKPIPDFFDLKGSIKKGEKFSDKEADKQISKFIQKEYAGKTSRS